MDRHPQPVVERTLPPAIVTRVGNPVLTWLLSRPRTASKVGQDLLLLHVTGRRTGRVYSTPVAHHRDAEGSLIVLTSSPWRVNLRGAATPVEVTFLGRRLGARARLEEDPVEVARVYQGLIGEVGTGRAERRLGIRVTVDRVPTLDELAEAVGREHLSVVFLDLDEEPA